MTPTSRSASRSRWNQRMTGNTMYPMNLPSTGAKESTEVQASFSEFSTALENLANLSANCTPAERDRAELAVCFASRSTYTDWYVQTRMIDPEGDVLQQRNAVSTAQKELDMLFTRAVETVQTENYRHSLEGRYEEFLHKWHAVCELWDVSEHMGNVRQRFSALFPENLQ